MIQSFNNIFTLFICLQCIASSCKPGEDALPQPSRFSIPCAPHLFLLLLFHLLLPFLAQTPIPRPTGISAPRREAHKRPWRHQRAVHAAVRHAPLLSGWAAQPGPLSAGQAPVVHALSLPAGPEALPVSFALSPIRRHAVIVAVAVFTAVGKEAPEWD